MCRSASAARPKWHSSRCAGSPGSDESTSLDAPPAIEQEVHRLGIGAMFLREDPRRQRLGRILLLDRHLSLQNNRTSVKLSGDQVYGHPADPDAVLNRLPLRVDAGER